MIPELKKGKPNVTKVEIVAYKDKTMQTRIGSFLLPINPENYSEVKKVNYDSKQGVGQQSTNPRYKSTTPEELKLDFILDGTGTVEGYAYKDVSIQDQVAALYATVYLMNGDIHRPNFLRIFWGGLNFPCILNNIDIKCQVFDSDGKPIRAKVSATFRQYLPKEEREKRENKKSPDITHIRPFKEGNRLDLMAYNIYTESQFALQVARANGLTSFRNVKVGSEIIFPPLLKTEK